MAKERSKAFSVRDLTLVSMMVAITVILMFTPVGTIRLPIVSITIAHVPAIITAIVLGPLSGFFVALAFGVSSLFIAITAPTGILDPFFQNPLVSILPRILIPLTAYLVYKGLHKLLGSFKAGEYISVSIGVIVGNLTNTFGVYAMLYFVYAKQIFEKTGKPALNLIITAISTTTLIKTVGIVIVAVPVIYALNKFVYRKQAKR